MENVAYIGLSRQTTLRRQLDIAANNIANADTPGFKVENLLLNSQAATPARNDEVRGGAVFVVDGGVGRDFRQGAIRETGRPFDLAIDGQGFFRVSTPQGDRYTRDGRFTLDDQGRLTTQDGHPVLDEGGGEIQIDAKKGAVTVGQDGAVSQGSERVGKVGLFRFPILSVLTKEGDNLYANASNSTAEAATEARVRQGAVEGSNVSPVLEITNLIEISRAYERVSRIIEQNNDLSQRTVERLGRVT